MPYKRPIEGEPEQECPVCNSPANIPRNYDGLVVFCSRCGDFNAVEATELSLPLPGEKMRALASYLIRKLQGKKRPTLTPDFLNSLAEHSLPTPAELCDNLLLWLADQADGRAGKVIGPGKSLGDLDIVSAVGAIDAGDVTWAMQSLTDRNLVLNTNLARLPAFRTTITSAGWDRVEELKRAHVASRYAFFARRFANADLDRVYTQCLLPAVKQTGYDLRTVTQKAGHIDALIEGEIRRCRFLVADLSDNNPGAYWEAGFAEGLGKPVIYICCAGIQTHFDTNHRHTVRWDVSKLTETAANLKAVIRNTLLGDAIQED
ncbi:nucleoside 2-deoxyribosyltransferase [Bradyrhizobium acaciae]|uniref:nucleoside 2-deoxyribosyltransferase n=1 Tax=Bradyrhizobium acaciae TaxID=2683706 RepID=UPI001E488770|nr:nucleoside 2-deoxyribosyltransferase [Bradyrhizobium acaciae]MCC8982640.1 hypothetical protein [Bradyrhizobium acaciae]